MQGVAAGKYTENGQCALGKCVLGYVYWANVFRAMCFGPCVLGYVYCNLRFTAVKSVDLTSLSLCAEK